MEKTTTLYRNSGKIDVFLHFGQNGNEILGACLRDKQGNTIFEFAPKKAWANLSRNRERMCSLVLKKYSAAKPAAPAQRKKTRQERLTALWHKFVRTEAKFREFVGSTFSSLLDELVPSGKKLDIFGLDREEYDLYGLGITVYGRHGNYETGIPAVISRSSKGYITIECNGAETDLTYTVSFSELKPFSQYYLCCLLGTLISDCRENSLTLRETDDTLILESPSPDNSKE